MMIFVRSLRRLGLMAIASVFLCIFGCSGSYEYNVEVLNKSGVLVRDVTVSYPNDAWKFEFGDLPPKVKSLYSGARMPAIPQQISVVWKEDAGPAYAKEVAISESLRTQAQRSELLLILTPGGVVTPSTW